MRDIITKLEELNTEKANLNEGLGDMAHEAEKDHEVQMARSDCYKSAKYAVSIHKMLKDVSEMEGIDGWVASKLTKAADYLGSVKHYMEGEMMSDVELAVVPVAGDMTDAMTMEEKEECRYCGGNCPNDEDNACDGYLGDIDGLYAESVEVVEAEERTYIVVHAKHGKEEIKASSSYGAAKKYAEMKKLKSTAGVDAHLADEEKTATESVEVTEDRAVMVRATNIDYAGPALDKLPTDVNVKVMVNPGDSEDEIFDMVADELEDRYGVKVSGFDMKMMENALDETILGEKDTMMGYGGKPLPKRTPQSKAAAGAAIGSAPGVPAGTKGTSLDAWKGGKIPANIANNPTYQSEPGKAWIKQQQAAAKKHFGEEQVAEEDVIGDIIDKLEKMGIKGKTPQKPRTSMPLKMGIKGKTPQNPRTSMPLPKPKPAEPIGSDPETGATKGLPPEEVYSPQQLQQIANQNRIRKPALKKESKFADWSKK